MAGSAARIPRARESESVQFLRTRTSVHPYTLSAFVFVIFSAWLITMAGDDSGGETIQARRPAFDGSSGSMKTNLQPIGLLPC